MSLNPELVPLNMLKSVAVLTPNELLDLFSLTTGKPFFADKCSPVLCGHLGDFRGRHAHEACTQKRRYVNEKL
jgi:hypothetical protein